MAYEIEFAASVKPQVQALTADRRSRLWNAIEQQLRREPLVETRNRKKLRPNPVAPWELRVGALQVFYDVTESTVDPQTGPAVSAGTVQILAVGEKAGNVLRIGGEEVQL
jgi:hypothetical protein